MAFCLEPLLYGSLMASIDTFMLSLLKAIHLGWVEKAFMIIPTIIYACQPWIFLSALKFESMTTMNLLWDVLSDVLVTFTGLYYFREKISQTKLIGVAFSFVAIFLLTYDG